MKLSGTFGTAVLSLLLAGLMLTSVQLVRENSAVRAQLASASGAKALEVGDKLKGVVGVDLDGVLQDVPLVGADDHLLILFSATCAFCLESFERYRDLELTVPPRVNVVWLLRDDPEIARTFFQRKSVAGRILMSPTYGTYRNVGLSFVPQLIAVDSDGVVQQVWRGAPTDDGWADIDAYLDGEK